MRSLETLVITYHNNLSDDFIDWLIKRRGLNNEIIDKHQLGLYNEHLCIPLYDSLNKCVGFKYRLGPREKDLYEKSSKYWHSPGCSAQLYGWEHIINPKSKLIICEGELDRLILETNGLPAVTSTAGAGTFKDEWIASINSLSSEILICYDNDEAGMAGAEKIAKCVPKGKIVWIPKIEGAKDATEFIMAKGLKEFNKLLDEAKDLKEIELETKFYERRIRKELFS